MSNNWAKNRRSCSTVWTHPDIRWQVIWMHNTSKITWKNMEFDTPEEAMNYAERDFFG